MDFTFLPCSPAADLLLQFPDPSSLSAPTPRNFAALTRLPVAHARYTSPQCLVVRFSGENISTILHATKSTSTDRPTSVQLGTSPTLFPKVQFATFTTSFTTRSQIASGC